MRARLFFGCALACTQQCGEKIARHSKPIVAMGKEAVNKGGLARPVYTWLPRLAWCCFGFLCCSFPSPSAHVCTYGLVSCMLCAAYELSLTEGLDCERRLFHATFATARAFLPCLESCSLCCTWIKYVGITSLAKGITVHPSSVHVRWLVLAGDWALAGVAAVLWPVLKGEEFPVGPVEKEELQ